MDAFPERVPLCAGSPFVAVAHLTFSPTAPAAPSAPPVPALRLCEASIEAILTSARSTSPSVVKRTFPAAHACALAFIAAAVVAVTASVDAAPVTCNTVAACVLGTNTSSGPGVGGSSASGFGVSGSSKSGHGVNGTSASSFGVVGTTTENATSTGTARAGVLGQDGSTNKKTFNSGVAGTSAYGIGVFGQGGKYGGYFTARKGVGIFAAGATIAGPTTTITGDLEGIDVYPSGGINGPVTGETAIHAYANTQGGGAGYAADNLFLGTDCYRDFDYPTPQCSDAVSIDGVGNAIFAGTVTQNGTPLIRTKSLRGADVASFGARTATPTLEDFGKAQLRGGSAYVLLDRTFAATIDPHAEYMVFVTPESDSNGLYATNISATGFTVRENKGGHSSLTFNYRIAARPYDSKPLHLPAISAFKQLRRHETPPKLQR